MTNIYTKLHTVSGVTSLISIYCLISMGTVDIMDKNNNPLLVLCMICSLVSFLTKFFDDCYRLCAYNPRIREHCCFNFNKFMLNLIGHGLFIGLCTATIFKGKGITASILAIICLVFNLLDTIISRKEEKISKKRRLFDIFGKVFSFGTTYLLIISALSPSHWDGAPKWAMFFAAVNFFYKFVTDICRACKTQKLRDGMLSQCCQNVYCFTEDNYQFTDCF